MEVLMKIVQLVLALSLLVLVHEFGHFLFAKIFGMKVDKFYLFFDPWFSVVKYKPKDSDTEYGIGWLPLGGYCKIAGMIDESMDKEALKKEPQPWEFRAKPAWQRFFVLFGGVLFNLILAIILYSALLYSWGDSYIRNEDVTTGVVVNDVAYDMGFRNGDRIISVDGEAIDDFNQIHPAIIRKQAKEVQLLRDGKEMTISIDPVFMPAMLNGGRLFDYGIPFVIDSVDAASSNVAAGFQHGDRILGIDSTEIPYYSEVAKYLQARPDSKVIVKIHRDGIDTIAGGILSIEASTDSLGRLGIYADGNLEHFFKVTERSYNIVECVPAGFNKAITTVSNYWKELKLIVKPQTGAYKSVGSFIAIGSLFPGSWNWYFFWNICAFLSIILAVMNILPIPALDGGHILFTLYEMITGRKPSDKFLEVAQTIGMIFLILLMIFAFGNDIFRLFK